MVASSPFRQKCARQQQPVPDGQQGLDRVLDVGDVAFLELGEQRALLVDRQREQPVQELRHGEQVVLQIPFLGEFEAGGGLERIHGPLHTLI